MSTLKVQRPIHQIETFSRNRQPTGRRPFNIILPAGSNGNELTTAQTVRQTEQTRKMNNDSAIPSSQQEQPKYLAGAILINLRFGAAPSPMQFINLL